MSDNPCGDCDVSLCSYVTAAYCMKLKSWQEQERSVLSAEGVIIQQPYI